MARILIGNIKPTLVNNALTTQAGLYALDAAMGYTLDDKIGKVSSDLAGITNRLLFSGDIDKIEFGYEDNLNPSVAKHYIAFWHTNGTKSLLSFNNSNIFYDYWDKTQWFNLWTK